MTVIEAATLPGGNLRGEEHGATISLILDDSEPGHGRGCTAIPTTRPGSSSREPSPSNPEKNASPPERATS